MKILVKFPCRERPQKLLERLNEYKSLANDKDIQYLVSLDNNDETVKSGYMQERLKDLGCKVFFGDSNNKVHACNRDIEKADPWDILVLASDDMVCVQQGWDSILKSEMVLNFPDTDGVLWHSDGYVKDRLNTMCILGRAYYERFNYIYAPEYHSLFCDNEFTDIANALGKQKYFEQVLFSHAHPMNVGGYKDRQYIRTESYYHIDKLINEQRKSKNYGLLAER